LATKTEASSRAAMASVCSWSCPFHSSFSAFLYASPLLIFPSVDLISPSVPSNASSASFNAFVSASSLVLAFAKPVVWDVIYSL